MMSQMSVRSGRKRKADQQAEPKVHKIVKGDYGRKVDVFKLGDADAWEVEKVVGSRLKRGKTQYFVKWKGFKKPTWADVKSNDSFQELIRQYCTANKNDNDNKLDAEGKGQGEGQDGGGSDSASADDKVVDCAATATGSSSVAATAAAVVAEIPIADAPKSDDASHAIDQSVASVQPSSAATMHLDNAAVASPLGANVSPPPPQAVIIRSRSLTMPPLVRQCGFRLFSVRIR
jgi:hypothetical protein